MTDSNLGNNRIQGLNNLSVVSTQLQFYGMSNGVAQMVTDIKNALGGGQIDVLRIWGHGGPGLQNVTAGDSGSSANADFSGLTQDNYDKVGIDGLTGLFTQSGCQSPSGRNDRRRARPSLAGDIEVLAGKSR